MEEKVKLIEMCLNTDIGAKECHVIMAAVVGNAGFLGFFAGVALAVILALIFYIIAKSDQ